MKLVEHIEPIRLLMEEKIRSFCRFKFPDLKIEDIISILEYSDDWYADSSVGVVSVAFPDTSERSFGSYLEIMNDKSLQEVQLKADVKADYRLDGGQAALVKALMLKPKYKGYITAGGDGAFSFSGPISLYVGSLCPDMVVRGIIPTTDVRFADKPVTIQGKYEDIKKFLSLMFKQFGDASSWNGGFEFVKPLTPKMRWLIQTAYKMIDPKTAGQQAKPVADDYVLDKLPDPENPSEMKSRSGKALKNGDIVSVGGTRYIYSSDQYFQVGSNPAGTKQNQVPLQLIDGRFYGFSPETKTFSVKVDGSPSDVAEDAVMKSMPAKGNPVDPQTKKKDQKRVVLFKNNGTPFSVGDLFKIKGSNKFEQVVEPDKHVDSIGQLAKFFKDNQIIQRISAFNIIRTKELRQLAARKADTIQEAEEKGWSDKQLEARLAEIEEETKNEWKIGFDIDKVKSFGELKKYVKTASDFNVDVDESSEYSNIEESDPVHGNACAKRRVKLFEAAKKRGAKIFTTAEWTAAVCYNAAQTAPFGRVKPKVKSGTNEIDPACNLEDWETDADGNKITPENKKKRDDYKCVGSQTIKDSIDDGYSNSFNVINNTNMPAAKFAEAAWCVCGAEEKRVDWNSAGSQSFFNNYTNNGKRPMVVLMQNSRGAIYMYARFIGYDHSVIVNMLNEAGHVDGSSKTDTASQMKMYSGMCDQNRSFNDLMKRINTIYFPDTMPKNNKLADKQIRALQDDSAPSHKCAARRMKLFAAAEHYGATVGQTSDWVYAVCTKPDQIHPFGRNKPVVLPGTNEIDPACNLEDWETDADGNKITAANRAKRDDKTRTYPRVKDGITTGDGKSLDEHASHTGQSKKGVYNAEANWCVCGTLDGHYEWTYPNLKYGYPSYYDDMHPLIAFMEKSTGRMYLYANKGSEEFKNELDLVEVKTGNWLYGDFYKQHPSFAVLHKLLCSRYYQIGGDENASPEELYDKAFQTGMVTKNGFIKIKNRNEALKYQPIFDRFSGIYVDNEQAAEMFCGVDVRAVDVVDFTNVRSASRAFRQSNIGTIRIVGSGRVSDMGYMFEEAQLDEITEIDTSGAATIQNFVAYASTEKNGPLTLPQLDLKNCVCAIGAFTGTNVRKVSLKNTDKITDARRMYANCPYLAVFPDIRFKNVKSVRGLAESGEWKDVFSGCATLHSLARRKKISGYGKDGAQKEAKFQAELEKIKDLPSDQYAVKRAELSRRIRGESIFDFDEMLEETRRFYEANWKSSEGIEIDENDMIVIRTARDVAESMAQFKNHAGVKVCMPDAARLFAESKLELKTLDMADVRSANEMFSGAKIIRLDNVINTEKLQNCDYMFHLAGVGFVPDMNLASVQSARGMFASAELLELPKNVKFGGGLDQNIKDPGVYFFGDSFKDGQTAKRLGAERMQTWAQNTVESCRTRMIAGQTTYAVDENGMLVASQDAVEKDADRKLLNSIVVNLEKYNKFRAEEGKPAVTGILVKGASDGVFTGPLLYQLRAPELDLPPITIDDGVAKVSQLLIDCNVRSVETINGLGHLKAADRLLQGRFKRIPSKMSFDSLVDGRNAFMNAVVDEKPKNGFISAPNLKRGNFMFSGSNMLEEVKIGKGGFEFPNIETAVGMFKIAALNSVEECSFPNLVDADHMFYHTRIKNGGAKRIDAPKAVTANVMFAYSDVQKIGRVQLPAAKNCVSMFEKCEKLRQIMKLDIPTVEHAECIMKSCTSLKSVPFLHISASAQTRDAMKHTPLEPVYGSDMQLYKIVIKNIG